jgi:hypothetical protein
MCLKALKEFLKPEGPKQNNRDQNRLKVVFKLHFPNFCKFELISQVQKTTNKNGELLEQACNIEAKQCVS